MWRAPTMPSSTSMPGKLTAGHHSASAFRIKHIIYHIYLTRSPILDGTDRSYFRNYSSTPTTPPPPVQNCFTSNHISFVSHPKIYMESHEHEQHSMTNHQTPPRHRHQRYRTCHVSVHTGHENSGAIHAVDIIGQYVPERYSHAVWR